MEICWYEIMGKCENEIYKPTHISYFVATHRHTQTQPKMLEGSFDSFLQVVGLWAIFFYLVYACLHFLAF